ncbi:MAG: WG repeat-containing protein [Bacillota bacterium]|nr:WG repeat-containing protein [Bacillota bacterium]
MKRIIVFILCIIFCMPSLSIYSANEGNSQLLPAVADQNGSQKWGFINIDGEFVIPPIYDFVNNFSKKGVAIVANKSSDYDTTYKTVIYFINTAGKIILGPFESSTDDFLNGYKIVEDTKGFKIIDEEGKIVLISKYKLESVSEGMIMYSEIKKSQNRYGYLDMKGNIIIPAKYVIAGYFTNGYANVMETYDKVLYIDKKGNVLKNDMSIESEKSNSIKTFIDDKTQKFGYKLSSGQIAIEAKFAEAGEFIDDIAIVAILTGEYEKRYGLIDTEGQYIIKPEYTSIVYIGQGLYAVNRKGVGGWNYINYPNAIFDKTGKQLSDFSYYNIQNFKDGYASVCSETQTFFIDKNACITTDLPVTDGIGTLEFIGDVVKAQCDNTLSYYRRDGSLIWRQDRDNNLKSGIKVKMTQYRPDYYTYFEYPEFYWLSDAKVQKNVNERLASEVLAHRVKIKAQFPEDESMSTSGYSINQNKDLLIIQTEGYDYLIGGKHDMPWRRDFPLNLKTGAIYSLKDLFKPNTKYKEKLTAIIRNQIALNNSIKEEKFYVPSLPLEVTITDSTGFTITRDALKIFFPPGGLTSYAAGFLSFDIPYGQIEDLIDTKGAFWISFDKQVIKNKIKPLTNISTETLSALQKQMKSYENKIIEAVNNNDFKKVEALLLKGSSLYNDQKKLVKNLYSKNIKEKLIDFDIYAIGYLEENQEYKVYIVENIGIKYPSSKSYSPKKFRWFYTIKYDTKEKAYKLSNISNWT